MKADYNLRAHETFMCPICRWRVTSSRETSARLEMRFHFKHEHKISGNRLKLLKAK
jgi:uncharacterized protein YlaI